MAAGTITLNSGHQMPVIGLGVWRMEGQSIRDLILSAIKIGYRHLDCAADYKNESEVGQALAEALQTGLVKREELFITSKLWNSDHGHVLEACKDSLKKLQLEYLDLYLVHFPIATRHTGVGTTDSALAEDGVLDIDTTIPLETTWHAMEDLVSTGLARSIGISNYDIFLTRDCLAYSKIKPAVNQIETHPYFQRDSLIKFCHKHGICVTAHTPLGGAAANTDWFGTVSCLDDPIIQELANKYKKTVAQLILRWGIQRKTVVIPKSSKLERLQENFQVFDFTLSEEDVDKIKAIDRKYRTNQPAKFWGLRRGFEHKISLFALYLLSGAIGCAVEFLSGIFPIAGETTVYTPRRKPRRLDCFEDISCCTSRHPPRRPVFLYPPFALFYSSVAAIWSQEIIFSLLFYE